jgi:hypothetical protein
MTTPKWFRKIQGWARRNPDLSAGVCISACTGWLLVWVLLEVSK